jgi:hypothetical protein
MVNEKIIKKNKSLKMAKITRRKKIEKGEIT